MFQAISIETKFVPPSDPSLPALVLQVTRLVGSYMIWVGATTITGPQEAQSAISHGKLTRDWACAMPPVSVRCYPILRCCVDNW
jgi:proteasome assembly chaperone 4